ncbi:MAG TPA: hypothetical protein VLG38_06140, partial [Gammaproteobacteria bacterium]|nr:hypothetical protein [Gammaproteobacteria bacterium]
LPSALQLFQDAISTGNLELVRSLHPHCKDRIDETFYFDLFAKWVCDIKDEELILKMRAVFDYLFQNCEIFKSCLQALQSVLPTTGNYSASFLFIAIVKKKRVALEALLAYGFSPNGILSYNAATKKVDSALDTITALPNDEFKAFVIKLLMEHGFDPRYKVITEPVRDSSSHLKQVASKLAVQIHQRFKFSYYVDREFNPLSHYCRDVRRVTPELRDFLIVKSSMHDLLDSLVQFYSSMVGSHFEAHSSVPGIRLHLLDDRVQKTPGDFICLHVFFSNKLELEYMQAVLNEINKRRRTVAPDNNALLEMQAKAQEFEARNKHRLAARTYFSIAMYFLTSIEKLTANDVKEIIKNLELAAKQMLKHAPGDNLYDIRKRQEFVYSSTLLAMEIATACKQKIDDTLVSNLQAIFPELPPTASSYVLGKLEHLNLTDVKEILRTNTQGATKLSKGPGQ